MAKKKPTVRPVCILLPLALCAQEKHNFSVSGTIKDKRSGETLSGATIGFLDHPGLGVVPCVWILFHTIPEGKYAMVVSFSGYAIDTVALDLTQNIVLNRVCPLPTTRCRRWW